jgi:hypothetical protein
MTAPTHQGEGQGRVRLAVLHVVGDGDTAACKEKRTNPRTAPVHWSGVYA